VALPRNRFAGYVLAFALGLTLGLLLGRWLWDVPRPTELHPGAVEGETLPLEPGPPHCG
jgi:hypothetical protein